MYLRTIVLILVCISLSACVANAPKPGSSYQRGWVVNHGNEYTYRHCFGRHTSQLSSASPALRRYMNQFVDSVPIYVEWIGESLPQETVTDIQEIRFMSADPESCRVSLSGVLLRASGARRNWVANVHEDYIQVVLNEERKRITYPLIPPQRDGADWVWDSEIELSDKTKSRLNLRVTSRVCNERDEWYRLTAEMEIDGRFYRGCAKRGRLERSMLFTQYSFPYYVSTRSIDLHLYPDGEAFLHEDYQGIQPIVQSTGQWSVLPDRRLMIQLAYNNDMLRQEVLMFKIGEDGAIVMEQGHSRYGPLGLELIPAGVSMPWEPRLLKMVP